jgi:RNA polymerase sigma factor (sigma-70 family)
VTDSATTSRLAHFEALFTQHQRAVLAYTMRRAHSLSDAEDVAAETFAICWRKLDSVPQDEPLPWLYAVARRVLANQRRGAGRRERLAAVLRQPDVPTPLRAGDDMDGPAFEALASLSPADQELLRLVAWEELGNREIAQVLGISPNAVAIRLHRARARFSAALKDPDSSRTSVHVKGTRSAAWNGEAQ